MYKETVFQVIRPKKNFLKEYKSEGSKKIGKGTFGKVVFTEHIKSGEKRAVKIVEKKKMMKKGVNMSLLENEARIMIEMDHPNIVKFHEIYEDEGYLYFVMEYLKGGNLHEHFIKHTKN